jgi:hypothetical protein
MLRRPSPCGHLMTHPGRLNAGDGVRTICLECGALVEITKCGVPQGELRVAILRALDDWVARLQLELELRRDVNPVDAAEYLMRWAPGGSA